MGLLARLPKLRKDARANVETVLHELISDKNATIPQICACTGMALRTINNALATLRAAKIVLPREAAEKPHIGDEKQPIESEKPHIGDEKPHIEGLLSGLGLTRPTEENILKLFQRFGEGEIFGRHEVRDTTGLQDRASSALIGQMLRHRLLDTVKGHGKGKYRFRSEFPGTNP